MSAIGISVVAAAKLLVANSRNDGAQTGPVIRRSTFYLYIVFSMLVLLLAFAGWGSYMIRNQRSVHRFQGFHESERAVSTGKLERPKWSDVRVSCEETSGEEPSPISAFIMDDPPNVAFPLHCTRLLPAIHARPIILTQSAEVRLQLAYLIAMPTRPTTSSETPPLELGVKLSAGKLAA